MNHSIGAISKWKYLLLLKLWLTPGCLSRVVIIVFKNSLVKTCYCSISFLLSRTEGYQDIFSGFRLIWNKGKGREDDLTLDNVRGRLMCNKYAIWMLSYFHLKGVTGYVRLLNWVCRVVENFFRVHLRQIKLFKDL